MDDLIAALRAEGLVVVPPCRSCPLGRAANAVEVETAITGMGAEHDGADEVNALTRLADRPVAYIDRTCRVWLLSDGPGVRGPATVYFGAYRNDVVTDEQAATGVIVLDALADWYGFDADADAGVVVVDALADDDAESVPTPD